MELWIRSQNKRILAKCEHLHIVFNSGNYYIADTNDEEYYYGAYSTKEQALDVLDEIQSKMTNNFLLYNASMIYQMPENEGE